MELGLDKRASEVAKVALTLQKRVDDPAAVAAMYVNVARSLLKDGRVKDCLESLRKAEDLYESFNCQTEVARARTSRGIVYATEGEFVAAATELRAALEIFREVGFAREEARTINELARLERLSGNPDEAEALSRRALELLKEMKAVPELALAHRELALSISAENSDEAAKHLRVAIELYEQCGEHLHAADTYRLLGDLLVEQASAAAWGEYRMGLVRVADALDRRDEVADLQAEVDRLNEGSLWKQRIMMFLMTAKADGTMQEFIDEQVRMRLEELCRTEDRYIEVSEVLGEAGPTIRDGKVHYIKDDEVRLLEEVLRP